MATAIPTMVSRFAGDSDTSRAHLLALLMRLGDDHLILGHRLSEWCGHAPMLEEDLALPNMALDLLGTARMCYGYAAEIEGGGKTEDDYAFLRDGTDFRHVLMVEQPNGDFAFTILRQFFSSRSIHFFSSGFGKHWLGKPPKLAPTPGPMLALGNPPKFEPNIGPMFMP